MKSHSQAGPGSCWGLSSCIGWGKKMSILHSWLTLTEQWLDGVMIWWCCLPCELRLWLWLLGPEIYHSVLLDKSDCQPVSLSICISTEISSSRYTDIKQVKSEQITMSIRSTRVCRLKCTTMGLILTQSIDKSWISLYNFVLFVFFPVLLLL